MSLVTTNCVMYSVWNSRNPCINRPLPTGKGGDVNPCFWGGNVERRRRIAVRAFFFNLAQDPVLKEALKEPVAFLGGVFAGVLRLDLNEDPLKERMAHQNSRGFRPCGGGSFRWRVNASGS